MRIMTLEDGKQEADLITLELIPNDLTHAPLGEITDTSDDTFCGNLNQILEYLLKNTKAMVALLIAARPRYSVDGSENKYLPTGDFIQEAIRWEKAVEAIASMHGVPCFNAASEAGLGYYRVADDDGEYYNDNIHLARGGGRVVANYFWSRLKNLSPFDA
jgi:hypothetical protein